MKKFLMTVLIAGAAFVANAQTAQKDITKILSISNDNYDFGKIVYGKPVEYALQVKNISSEPVTIENVQVGCGCTTPKYTKGQVIAPGESASITLGFNGMTKGNFQKSATLFFSGALTKPVAFHGVAE